MKRLLVILAVIAPLTGISFAFSNTSAEPIYLYLYARITDHVNTDIAQDQVRRSLNMVEAYRKAYPDAHVSATLLFSGAAADALAKENSNTHIVDLVRSSVRHGAIEVGYDGNDEPTYETRPYVDYTTVLDPEARSAARKQAEWKLLTEARDPLTGTPEEGKAGGLKRMQEVFGPATCIVGIHTLLKAGNGPLFRTVSRARVPDEGPKPIKVPPGFFPEVGGDSEAVAILETMNPHAIMFGIPDTNPANVPGFRDGRAGFSRLVSPDPETPPELYWQDGVLRSSEAGADPVRLVRAFDGPEALQKVITTADRTKMHVLHILIADEQIYLTDAFKKGPDGSALMFAYQHPTAPALPEDARTSAAMVEAAYARQEALLKWVTDQLIPGNPGSSFVSSTRLQKLAMPPTGFAVSTASLRKSLSQLVATWGNDTYAPPLFSVDGRYLSRAELFQVMVDELAAFHQTGKLPDSVEVRPVHGPVRLLTGHGPNSGEVSVAELAAECDKISSSLRKADSGNVMPIAVSFGDQVLNPAQVLRLMAHALANPDMLSTDKLPVRMTYQFTGLGQLMPRTRPDMDDGFIWTIKPAQLKAQTILSSGM